MPDPNQVLHQFKSAFASHDHRGTKTILGLLTVFWLVGSFFPTSTAPYFALTPGYIFSNYYMWTLITAGFYETSFLMGLLNLCCFTLVAPSLERIWGNQSFYKFVLVVNVEVMVTVFIAMVTCFFAVEAEVCLFRPVAGFSGVNAALAVALKQRFPERPVVPWSSIPFADRFRFKHVPIVLLPASFLLWLFGQIGGKEGPLVFFGTLYGWIYLRFYMVDQDTGSVGDLRSDFSFASLFPDVGSIRPVIEFVTTIIFQSLLRVGLFSDAVKSQASLPLGIASNGTVSSSGGGIGGSGIGVGGATSNSGIGVGGMGGTIGGPSERQGLLSEDGSGFQFRSLDPTAERRRILAIKAIDDKLAELAKQPHTNLGLYHADAFQSISIDEDEERLKQMEQQLQQQNAALQQQQQPHALAQQAQIQHPTINTQTATSAGASS